MSPIIQKAFVVYLSLCTLIGAWRGVLRRYGWESVPEAFFFGMAGGALFGIATTAAGLLLLVGVSFILS